jgi:hypothetical protein
MEVEGNLSFLLLILFSSIDSLKSVIIHYNHEMEEDGLEKILNKFPARGKPFQNYCIQVL